MSKIQWTNETWNPINGCTKVSEGCKNCYAEKFAWRLAHNPKTQRYFEDTVKNGKWNNTTHFFVDLLYKPYHWKKPRMIFVCSMSDLFHEATPFEWILEVWNVMCSNPRHTYQLLTKRPERVIEFLKWLGNRAKNDELDSIPTQSENPMDYISVPDFIWIGVTAENQEQADKRIPILLQIQAKLRFISCEPLLSEIDLSIIYGLYKYDENDSYHTKVGSRWKDSPDWVIAGPETGHGRRPMLKKWIENLYEQCKSANVPFFDKKDTLGLNLKQFPKT